MRWTVLARYSAIALAALVALAIVTALTLDLGRFKGGIETYLSEALEREIRMEGPLSLTLGGTIALRAEGVRIASTEWSAEPDLARAALIEASIDTWSLLGDTVRIEALRIEGARIHLERNAAGEANWTLTEQVAGDDEQGSSDSLDQLPVIFDDTRITDAVLSFNGPDRPRPLVLTLNALAADTDEADRLSLALEGALNETPLGLQVVASRVEDLIDLGAADFELSGNLGEIGLEGNASVADLLNPSRPTAQLNLTGPNIEYLTDILGMDRVTSGPLDLSLTVAEVGERMQLNLSGDAGEFAVLATGQFEDLQQLQNMDLQISASGPSAQTVAGIFGWPEVPDDPFNVIGTLQSTGSDVAIDEIRITIGDTQFDINGRFVDFPDPNSANASLRIIGPDFGRFNRLLGLPGRLEGAFEVVADLVSLETGGATLDLTASAEDITLSAQGTLVDTPDFVGTDLRIEFSGPDLSVITRAAGRATGPEEAFTGRLSAERVADGAIIEDGEATVGEDRFTFDGRIGDELPLSWAFAFEATSPDLKTRLAEFGVDYQQLPAGDLQAAGSVESVDGGYALDRIVVSYGNAEAELNGTLGAFPALEGTDLTLRASGEVLSDWLPPRDEFSALDEPFVVEGNVRLIEGQLELSGLGLQIDESRLTVSAELMPGAILERGRFSIEATSPDLLALSPQLSEVAVRRVAPLELQAAGDWADNRWNLSRLDMGLGEGTLRASGTIDGPPNFEDTDLTFDWNISSLNNFSVLARHPLPDEPARLTFTVTGTRNEISINDFDGVFGDSDIQGEFSLTAGDIPAIDIDVTSNLLDLTPFLPPEPEAPTGDEPDVADEDGRVIPDTPVRIDVLNDLLVAASVSANEVRARDRVLSNVVFEASVADGALRVEEFALHNASGGSLNGLMALRPSETGPEFGMRLMGDNISLGLPAFTPEELEDLPRYELNLAFITTGHTVREMAGNMNGYLRLVGGEGRMRIGAMRVFTQDFLYELFNTLNPFTSTDPYSNLRCTAILAAVEGGSVVGDPALVLQSDRINIFANARVDLKTERVDADFNTVPQQGLGLSLTNLVNPYVKVSGTLANPSLGLDAQSTLIEGGAAVATGGLSILAKSFADRFLSSRDPCGRAISDADEQFRELEARYGRSGSAEP